MYAPCRGLRYLNGDGVGLLAIAGQQLSTDFPRWWLSERRALPYRVPCFDKPSFEPYLLVAKRADTPRFDE